MNKRIEKVRASVKEAKRSTVIIFSAALLDLVFIWYGFALGEDLLVFVGEVVLLLLACMRYYIYKQDYPANSETW